MAQFGLNEARGLLLLIVLIAAAIIILRFALAARGYSAERRKLTAKLEDFEEREELNRLRHRDFDAFLALLNERRARLGAAPLSKAEIEPHRFNLMYSVEAGDIDEAALAKLRKRVEKSVKTGGEPAVEAPEPL